MQAFGSTDGMRLAKNVNIVRPRKQRNGTGRMPLTLIKP